MLSDATLELGREDRPVVDSVVEECPGGGDTTEV